MRLVRGLPLRSEQAKSGRPSSSPSSSGSQPGVSTEARSEARRLGGVDGHALGAHEARRAPPGRRAPTRASRCRCGAGPARSRPAPAKALGSGTRIGVAGRDPRHRPGHDGHDLPRLRRRGAELLGRAYREFDQHFPRPGWVEHDAARDLGRHARGRRRGARRRGLRARASCRRSGSPTSARRSASGIRRPASRCTARSSGRTAAPPRAATSCARPATSRSCASAPASSSTRTSRARRSSGCWATSRACASRPSRGARCSARSTRGSSSSSPASTSPTPRTPRARCSTTSPRRLGRRAVRAARRARSARCPRCGRRSASSATPRGDALPGHDGVPVAGIAGDQQAALYGQACLDPGLGKNTYGTGSFVLLNAGDTPPPPPPGLLATVAWGIGERTLYALEAAIFVTGAGVQWLRDGLGIIERADETEALAASLDSNDGVYFVPALTGLGSPHWDPYARGTIVGLTRGSGARPPRARDARGDRLPDGRRRAAMEEAGRARSSPSSRPTAARPSTRWLMQFQADVLGVPVVCRRSPRRRRSAPRCWPASARASGRSGRGRARRGASAPATSRAWARTSGRR